MPSTGYGQSLFSLSQSRKESLISSSEGKLNSDGFDPSQ